MNRQSIVRALGTIAVFMLFALLFSCNRAGTASVQGTLQVDACETLQQSTNWTLQTGFVTMLFQGRHTEAAVAELRIQAYPGSTTHPNPSPQDLLLIEIHKPSLIKTNEAIPIVKFTPSLSAETPNNDTTKPSARAALQLGKSCPNHKLPFAIEGTLTFSKFDPTEGSDIEGTITLTLTPARAANANTKGSLSGNFAFPLHPSQELGKDWLGYVPGKTP